MIRIGLSMTIAAFGIATLMPFAGARADCVDDCQAATYCDSEMHASGECADKLNACYQRECNRTRYGSIAYDAESRAYGWSNELYDGPAAEAKALSNCKAHGSGCKVMIDFWNSCGAVAADQAGYVGSAYADTKDAAESQAIQACQSSGGTSCEVQVWSCARP
jgi:hypothetical protein